MNYAVIAIGSGAGRLIATLAMMFSLIPNQYGNNANGKITFLPKQSRRDSPSTEIITV